MQNNRPKRPIRRAGDGEAARFDIDSAPNCEPQVDAGWLAAFEAELNRVVATGELDVPF